MPQHLVLLGYENSASWTAHWTLNQHSVTPFPYNPCQDHLTGITLAYFTFSLLRHKYIQIIRTYQLPSSCRVYIPTHETKPGNYTLGTKSSWQHPELDYIDRLIHLWPNNLCIFCKCCKCALQHNLGEYNHILKVGVCKIHARLWVLHNVLLAYPCFAVVCTATATECLVGDSINVPLFIVHAQQDVITHAWVPAKNMSSCTKYSELCCSSCAVWAGYHCGGEAENTQCKDITDHTN